MKPRRSLLFIPADDMRRMQKAPMLNADSIILELEDGVALNKKAEARANIAALGKANFGRERLVRVNAPSTEFFEDDLRETIDTQPDGYVVPKVESADDVRSACAWLNQAEAARGWDAKAIRLIVLIETPRGVMNLREIAGADDRLDALVFGAEDLAGAMGVRRTPAAWEVFYARSAIVIAAAANDLQAIDMVSNNFADLTGLADECAFGRQLGYTGKMCIHPKQLEVVNAAFTPTPEEVAYARRVAQAHEANQNSGKGAFALDGKMIDMPIVKQAWRVLAMAGHPAVI